MKLEIKHLAPYLPYGLMLQHISDSKIVSFDGIYEIFKDGTFMFHWKSKYGTVNASSHYKPMLRPLSDLTKDIEHNGEKFVPVEWFRKYNHWLGWDLINGDLLGGEYDVEENKGWVFDTHNNKTIQDIVFITNKLFEWHFDVLGLIDKGLAVKK